MDGGREWPATGERPERVRRGTYVHYSTFLRIAANMSVARRGAAAAPCQCRGYPRRPLRRPRLATDCRRYPWIDANIRGKRRKCPWLAVALFTTDVHGNAHGSLRGHNHGHVHGTSRLRPRQMTLSAAMSMAVFAAMFTAVSAAMSAAMSAATSAMMLAGMSTAMSAATPAVVRNNIRRVSAIFCDNTLGNVRGYPRH